MAQAPSWAATAQQNTVGKKLGEESHPVKPPVQQAKKAGRPRSLIERKKVLLNMSEAQNERLTRIEGQLKAAGIGVTRGRSETVELALALLEVMLHSEEQRPYAMTILKDSVGQEERMLEQD
ncbi:hypothetical protein [Shewanella oncorhynchi]|jgi:hypothetical protein|uniref:hypothetical protein n=1 Tax=Shewanella oncorhynchi TaxID=2726434 RepID=UPI003D797006